MGDDCRDRPVPGIGWCPYPLFLTMHCALSAEVRTTRAPSGANRRRRLQLGRSEDGRVEQLEPEGRIDDFGGLRGQAHIGRCRTEVDDGIRVKGAGHPRVTGELGLVPAEVQRWHHEDDQRKGDQAQSTRQASACRAVQQVPPRMQHAPTIAASSRKLKKFSELWAAPSDSQSASRGVSVRPALRRARSGNDERCALTANEASGHT